MSVEKKPMYYLGLDIGGTKIWLYLTNDQGEVINQKKVDTSSQITAIVLLIKEFIALSSVSMDSIAFISCGVPGATNSKKGIVIDAPALQWNDFSFVEELKQYFDCPIYVENDVNCAAIGEGWMGNAKLCDNYIYLSIGTGVGCAIVTNGKLVRGHSYMAGEVGYLLLNEDIEDKNYNSIGEFGVFESKVSGTALQKAGGDPTQIFEDYYNGVVEVKDIIHRFEKLLSLSIANMISLLNPEKVIISGGVAQSMVGIINEIREQVKKFTPIPAEITLSSLGEAAGAVGAVAVGIERNREEVRL